MRPWDSLPEQTDSNIEKSAKCQQQLRQWTQLKAFEFGAKMGWASDGDEVPDGGHGGRRVGDCVIGGPGRAVQG